MLLFLKMPETTIHTTTKNGAHWTYSFWDYHCICNIQAKVKSLAGTAYSGMEFSSFHSLHFEQMVTILGTHYQGPNETLTWFPPVGISTQRCWQLCDKTSCHWYTWVVAMSFAIHCQISRVTVGLAASLSCKTLGDVQVTSALTSSYPNGADPHRGAAGAKDPVCTTHYRKFYFSGADLCTEQSAGHEVYYVAPKVNYLY